MNDVGFQQFFDEMPLAALLLEDGLVTYVNRAAARKLGDRFLGRPLSELLPADTAEQLIVGALEGRGTVFFGLPAADALFDVQSGLLGGQVFITLYPHEPAVETPGHLSLSAMFSLGGEIRAPLTPMLMTVNLLSSRLEASQDEKSRKYFSILTQNCYRLLRLSNNLTELPRYASGGLTLRFTERNLSTFAQEVLDSAAPFAEVLDVKLYYDCPDMSIWLAFDDQAVERMLLNLLSNALKHTPKHGRITLSVSADKGFVTLRVADNGEGIPPDQLVHLFRAHASHRPGGHPFGLGLPMVRMIAELHGGAVMLESRQGVGTSVTVSLRRTTRSSELVHELSATYDYVGGYSHAMVELSDSIPGGHPLFHPTSWTP